MTDAQPSAEYDGFISYAHAADGALAPQLQAGLQRFAKPWWRRRALRVFRDESGLSANPHLWSAITAALDSSAWLVLLLSPDAARSDWVGREITHWLQTRPADRILPVLTEGDLAWDQTRNDFDPTASTANPAGSTCAGRTPATRSIWATHDFAPPSQTSPPPCTASPKTTSNPKRCVSTAAPAGPPGSPPSR